VVRPRKRFEQELAELDQLILRMGSISEDMLNRMIQALKERNVELAEETVRMDDKVDALNLEIETTCIRLIATQQPQARDLRRIHSRPKNRRRRGKSGRLCSRHLLSSERACG